MSKFTTAYNSVLKTEVTARQVMSIELENPISYAREYEKKMVCPECKKAPVLLVRKASPFFRTYPNAMHEDGCLLTQDELERKTISPFVNDRNNLQEISIQLDRLFSKILGAGEVASVETEYVYSPIIDKQSDVNCRRATKVLPQRCITSQLSIEDCDVYKRFYGRVYIEWEDSRNGEAKKILIKTPDRSRFICRIAIPMTVFAYLDKSILNTDKSICAIVFLAQIQQQKQYYTGCLEHSRFLRIAKLNIAAEKRCE